MRSTIICTPIGATTARSNLTFDNLLETWDLFVSGVCAGLLVCELVEAGRALTSRGRGS